MARKGGVERVTCIGQEDRKAEEGRDDVYEPEGDDIVGNLPAPAAAAAMSASREDAHDPREQARLEQ